MIRTKIKDRALPRYSKGEERFNMISHIVGGGFSILALILCILKAARYGAAEVIASVIYGCCLIFLYTMSSIYHGLYPSTGKRVMQVMDHCAIYALIAGSYSIVCLGVLRRYSPLLGWGIFTLEWALCALATTLTAIDLKQYRVFSMTCYIGMGWAIIPLAGILLQLMGGIGFGLLLAGGISYTIGAVLFGLGKKIRWMHSIFHLFVVLGSMLHFFSFYFYGI